MKLQKHAMKNERGVLRQQAQRAKAQQQVQRANTAARPVQASPTLPIGEVKLYPGEPASRYRVLGPLLAALETSDPNESLVEQADELLKEKALNFRATAVMNVTHDRQTLSNGQCSLMASGTMVIEEPQDDSEMSVEDSDITNRLHRLDQLRLEKAITDEEYSAQRQRILNEL